MNQDSKLIDELLASYDLHINPKHLKRLVVVEDGRRIIAIGSLVTLLDGTFITTHDSNLLERLGALELLVKQCSLECKDLGYEHYHVFVHSDNLEKIIKSKYGFVDSNGKDLIKYVESE